MKLVSWARAQPHRIILLVTGNTATVNEYGTVHERLHFSWKSRWAISGIHSRNWKWVIRKGAMPCGCTRNPVTRKRILTRWKCPEHCALRHPRDKTVD